MDDITDPTFRTGSRYSLVTNTIAFLKEASRLWLETGVRVCFVYSVDFELKSIFISFKSKV